MLPWTLLYFPTQQEKSIGLIIVGIITQQEVTEQTLFG